VLSSKDYDMNIYLTILLFPMMINSIHAENKEYLIKVDKQVEEINRKLKAKCYVLEFKNAEFIVSPPNGTGELTIYKCEGKNYKIIERIVTEYGYKVRTFYGIHSKLKFVEEVHFEHEWDEKLNQYNQTMVRKIYSAIYYVEKDFYHHGAIEYEPIYRHKVEVPEPLTYVLGLIQVVKEYEMKKKN